MSPETRTCVANEELIAAATGEASEAVAGRVAEHVAHCGSCHDDYARYRAVDDAIGHWRSMPTPDAVPARERLLARLADLRSRIVRYAVFESPLGPILIATTETGIALVEYLDRGDPAGSRLFREVGLEPAADARGLGRFHRELMEYFEGRRTVLEWPLDLRLASSDFHRSVLTATAGLPFGAVSSYAGIAHDIGKPSAVRAVAQALRHNPVAIVVPCHRVIGSGGSLVGYAGSRVELKERLLALEGVRTERRSSGLRIDRRALYAWDRSCREYCLPTCGDISARPVGRVTLLATRREAQVLGLAPCQDCRPDLNPLQP